MRDKAIKQYKKTISPGSIKRRVLTVKNLQDGDRDKIVTMLSELTGVSGTEIDSGLGRITVTYDSARVSLFDLRDRLQENGYYARISTKN